MMKKRCMAVWIILGVLAAMLPAKANTIQNPIPITTNQTVRNAITETEEANWYQITLPSAGELEFKVTTYLERLGIGIYGSNYESITGDTLYWDGASQVGAGTFSYHLDKGLYYVRIIGSWWDDSSSYYVGNYQFETKFKSAGVNHSENNNNFETASVISTKEKVVGQIGLNNNCDYYKLSLPSSGRVKLKVTSYLERFGIRIYDDEFNSITGNTVYWEGASKVGATTVQYDLQKGTYFIRTIGNDWDDSDTYYYGNYKFTIKYTSAKVNHKEPNNSFQSAVTIKVNKGIRGQIALNNDVDYYKLRVKKSGKLNFKVSSNIERIGYQIYNSSFESLTGYTVYRNNTSGKTIGRESAVLSKGTYYIRFIGNYSDDADSYYHGNYSFRVTR